MSNNASPPSTRKRTSPQSQTRSASGASSVHSENLPPSRQSASMRTVSPPLSSTRLSRLIYLLVGLTTLLCAFYSYRTVQYKREVGGWWNLALGKPPSKAYTPVGGGNANERSTSTKSRSSENVVEERINALAEALGMPSNELASAIAGAVRSYVPPASLSSVAAKQTGEAVNVLLSEPEEGEQSGSKDQTAGKAAGHGMVDGILHGVESFAGLDEPSI